LRLDSRFYGTKTRTIWRWSRACERLNGSVGEIAIAWTLGNLAVTGAVVGACNAPQAEGVMSAGDLHLTENEVNEIEAFVETAA
jgi:aryl-alcohol dehydrogenase-like predicted oxidoreductase